MAQVTQPRPSPQGMSQGTYTGNISFSRGNTDLIARGATLPTAPTPTTPPSATPPPAKQGGPRFLTGVTFHPSANPDYGNRSGWLGGNS